MEKYRERVPAVEAFRWDGGKELWPGSGTPKRIRGLMRSSCNDLIIELVSGFRLVACVGDWIVIDGDGAKIVSDRVFTATYEPAEEDEVNGGHVALDMRNMRREDGDRL